MECKIQKTDTAEFKALNKNEGNTYYTGNQIFERQYFLMEV